MFTGVHGAIHLGALPVSDRHRRNDYD